MNMPPVPWPRRRILPPRGRVLCLLPALTAFVLSLASAPDVVLTYDTAGPTTYLGGFCVASLLGLRGRSHAADWPPAGQADETAEDLGEPSAPDGDLHEDATHAGAARRLELWVADKGTP